MFSHRSRPTSGSFSSTFLYASFSRTRPLPGREQPGASLVQNIQWPTRADSRYPTRPRETTMRQLQSGSALTLPRRAFLRLAAGAVAILATSHLLLAQPYPTRPVRLIVGFPPGG